MITVFHFTQPPALAILQEAIFLQKNADNPAAFITLKTINIT
jgi:hypothetical protein